LPAWDLITGQMAAVGLLAAERFRRRHGKGQHIKLALEDVGLAVMGHLGFIAEAQRGQTRERNGNYLFGAFGRDFLCADGERVMVVGLTAKQWSSLVDATQIHEGIALLESRLELDLRREGNRFRAREEIADLIGPWISARSLADVAGRFDKAGVCWSPYQNITQLIASSACKPDNNSMFSVVQQPGVGSILAPAIPLDCTVARRLPAAPAPELGEHTEEVLCGLLGIGESEYARLHDRGIVAGVRK
jgi:2-methylfumaryl-CoA isomerase